MYKKCWKSNFNKWSNLKKQRTRRDSGKYLRKNVNGCSIDKIVMAIRINGCVLRQHLRIYRNFCSVHEEITSIRLYTPCNSGLRSQGCVQPDWGYLEWTEQIISSNPYKLIKLFSLWYWKIYLFFQNKANNRK